MRRDNGRTSSDFPFSREVMTSQQYFADPSAAVRRADKVGQVVVRDADGTEKLIINGDPLLAFLAND